MWRRLPPRLRMRTVLLAVVATAIWVSLFAVLLQAPAAMEEARARAAAIDPTGTATPTQDPTQPTTAPTVSPSPTEEPTQVPSQDPSTPFTVLLQVQDDDQEARNSMLLAAGGPLERPVFVHLPATVLLPTDEPMTLQRTTQFQDLGVAHVGVSNLTGLRVDAVWTITRLGLSGLIDALDGLDLTLAQPFMSQNATGGMELRMPAGTHRFSGTDASDYVVQCAPYADQTECGMRFEQVLAALLEKLPEDPEQVLLMLRALSFASVSSIPSEELASFLAELATQMQPTPGQQPDPAVTYVGLTSTAITDPDRIAGSDPQQKPRMVSVLDFEQAATQINQTLSSAVRVPFMEGGPRTLVYAPDLDTFLTAVNAGLTLELLYAGAHVPEPIQEAVDLARDAGENSELSQAVFLAPPGAISQRLGEVMAREFAVAQAVPPNPVGTFDTAELGVELVLVLEAEPPIVEADIEATKGPES